MLFTAPPAPGLALLLVHLVTVWFLVGLVWVVQLLVYPGFREAGPHLDTTAWATFHARHTRWMARLVSGPWAVQGLTCAALLVVAPAGVTVVLVLVAGLSGAATAAVTLAVSLPCHTRLASRFDAAAARRLHRTNRWRTLAWTVGGVDAVAMLVAASAAAGV